MAYELRLGGVVAGTFETEEAAMAAAREAVLANPDSEPEVYDTETGQPAAPGASQDWRADLASKTAF